MAENDDKPDKKALKPEAIELMMQMAAEKRVVAPPLLRYSTNVGIMVYALLFFMAMAQAIYKFPLAGWTAWFAILLSLVSFIALRAMRRWGAIILGLFLILDIVAITLLVTKGAAGPGVIALAVILKLAILTAAVLHWHDLR